MNKLEFLALFGFLAFAASSASAAPPETVPVGDPGNTADTTGYGAVDYAFRIGKFEVTNAEYCEFLNAIAKADTHGLYDGRMAGEYGGIIRSGASGEFVYKTKDDGAKKPVSYITWESCARYANWLSNGGGDGDTEVGSYIINGGEITLPDHAELAAGKTTKWVISSENEWYKAAYYDPKKAGSGGYWPYALKGGSAPKCNLNSNIVTDVGAFSDAVSPYGTFDQNGNLWEYMGNRAGGKVGLRGGSFFINDHDAYLRSSTRYDVLSAKWPNYGFRVVALGSGKSVAAPPVATVPAHPVTPPVPAPSGGKPKTVYVSQSEGNDSWSGTSATRDGTNGPWKTLARASTEYIPGDTILLKRGDTWNEELRPKGNGTPAKPITIGAYGEGEKPVIDRLDDKKDLMGIHLIDQEGFKIVGIEFNRCMTGIYAEYTVGCPAKNFIWIEDCYFHDSLLYQHYEDYPKRKIGLGICFFSHETENRIVLADIAIKNCVFRRLASGVWTNSPDNFNKNASFVYNFGNMTFDGCLFEEGSQWQLGIRGVSAGAVRNCVTHDVGRNFRSFNGVAGAMFFRCKNWVFEDSEWGFVSIGLGSGDGEAFDFEGNCDNMTMRNCLFHDTDGPGFLICCYASDGNPNKGILMENCVINGKSKRPIGLPRCAIVNTTDWNEVKWKDCRFYLSKGEALMRVMDPEKEKRSSFVDCLFKNLSDAAATPNLAEKAKMTSSSQIPAHDARKANDRQTFTSWTADSPNDEWLQIEFAAPTAINEFKIKEHESSSVSRYVIEYWNDKKKSWASCFNGMEIGPEFVAPIVSRTTQKVRLRIMGTKRGNPSISEFEVYNDLGGTTFNDPTGAAAIKVMGE